MTTNQTSNLVGYVTTLLGSVGAVNWGLVGLLDFNLVSALLGEGSIMTKSVYIVVGLSGIYSIITIGSKCSTKSTT